MYDKTYRKLEEIYINTILMESTIIKDYKNQYTKNLLQNESMNNVLSENTTLVNDITFNNDPDKFFKSVYLGKRANYLSPYTFDEIKKLNVFSVDNLNAGFALKGDEIILVHNWSNINGLGNILIEKAKAEGGKKLDHYDGFLTGFYKKHGFKLTDNDLWDDRFAPESWEYKEINFDNPNTCIYVNEVDYSNLISKSNCADVDECKNQARDRYVKGKPDIVYRHL